MKIKNLSKPLVVLSASLLLAACGGNQPTPATTTAEQTTSVPATTSQPATTSEPATTSQPATTIEPATTSQPAASSQEAVKYTVTFNSKGGSAVKKQTVEEGGTATEPKEPSKSGYVFKGWYTDEEYQNPFDFATPINGNITLYAKWELNLERVLTSSITPESINNGDTELTLWTDESGLKMHNKNGDWTAEGNSFNMSWRTLFIVDSEGRVCYSVWCPANGYGGPNSYSYVSDAYYSAAGVGYAGNPAIKVGPTYPNNPRDFELVVPEGGFALTGHTNGATAISQAVSAGAINLYDGLEDDSTKRPYNATHGEWSSRRYKYNKTAGIVEVYDLASCLFYTGSKSGVFENDNDAKTATLVIAMAKNEGIKISLNDGLLPYAITAANTTIEGEFSADAGGDGTSKMFFKENDENIYAGGVGTYTLVYDFLKKEMSISFEKESEIDEDATLNCSIEGKDVSYAAFYDGQIDKSNLGDFTLGFNASGKLIYASRTSEGYGGPSDGFYHDGTYECVAGQVCGIFDIYDDFAPYPEKLDGDIPAWLQYNVVVPEGGCIITGTAAQIAPLILEMTGYDIADYDGNALFEYTMQDGAYNGYGIAVVKKTNFAQINLSQKKYAVSFVDVLGTIEEDAVMLATGDELTLPTPTNVPNGYSFQGWVDAQGRIVNSGTFQGEADTSYFALYKHDGELVAYTGKEKIKSTSGDSEFTATTDNTVVIHTTDQVNGWKDGTSWEFSWRTFAIIDAEGRVCYAVAMPANGYGGPNYSYHCDPYYGPDGEAKLAGNPAVTVLDGYGPWDPSITTPPKPWEQFTLQIPTGGFLISTHDDGANALAKMISSGELTYINDGVIAQFNKVHANWANRFAQDGAYVYTQLTLAE